MGLSLKEIRHSTLRELRYYEEAFRQKRKMIDSWEHMMGAYVFNAVSISLSNAFRGKNKTPTKYPEKSMMEEYEEKHKVLTEDEKAAAIAALFNNLGNMQKNFEKKAAE
jgi:hypothetical protein